MLGIGAYGELAFGQLRDNDDLAVADPLCRLAQVVDPQLRYLVELYPYSEDVITEAAMLPGPVGSLAFGQLMLKSKGGESGIYLSDHHFITEPDDPLPNQYYEPVVDNPIQYDMSLIRGNEVGVNSPTYGAIEITNGDGELDQLIHMSWKGRRIVVKAGVDGYQYGDYATVFDGLCNAIEFDDSSIMLTVSDKGLLLDKQIITPNYSGLGGLEGGDDLAGRMKPLVFGQCFNIEPVLLDASNLIYQVHAGSIEAFDAVFDSGVALTFDADYADINAVTPGAGTFATCKAKGVIKLGSTPLGRITANVRGDNMGGYVSKAGSICMRMAMTLYDNESFLLDMFDTEAWAAVDSAVPGAAGLYITDRQTMRQLFDALLNPCVAYWFFDRFGLLSAAIVDTVGVPTIDVGQVDLDGRGIEMVDAVPPAWRISVGYAPVWTVQAEDELAGAATDAQRSFVGNAYRLTTYENRQIRREHLQPLERTFYTNLAEKADADELLARLVRIYGQERRIYRGVRYGGLFGISIGDAVNFSYGRFGLNKPMMVMGLSEDAETASTSLELWG